MDFSPAILAPLILAALYWQCVPLAEAFSRLAFRIVSLFIPHGAKETWHYEVVNDYMLPQIWNDQKRGLPRAQVAVNGLLRAADLLLFGLGQRRYYRQLAGTPLLVRQGGPQSRFTEFAVMTMLLVLGIVVTTLAFSDAFVSLTAFNLFTIIVYVAVPRLISLSNRHLSSVELRFLALLASMTGVQTALHVLPRQGDLVLLVTSRVVVALFQTRRIWIPWIRRREAQT